MHNRFVLTSHAVEQFITRRDRCLAFDDAKQLLLGEIYDAECLHVRTLTGETLWHVPSLSIVLVTKLRRDELIVVTILADDKIKEYRQEKATNALAEADSSVDNSAICLKVAFNARLTRPGNSTELLDHITQRIRRLVEGMAKDLKHREIAEIDEVFVGTWRDTI